MNRKNLSRFQFLSLIVALIVSGTRCSGEDFGASVCVDGHSPRVIDASADAEPALARVTLIARTVEPVVGQPPLFDLWAAEAQYGEPNYITSPRLTAECEGRARHLRSVDRYLNFCAAVTVNNREIHLYESGGPEGVHSGGDMITPAASVSARFMVYSPSRLVFSTVIQAVHAPMYLGPIPTESDPRFGNLIVSVPAAEPVTFRWVAKSTGNILLQLRWSGDVGDRADTREIVCVIPQARGEFLVPQTVWNFFPLATWNVPPNVPAVSVFLSAIEQRTERSVLVESISFRAADFFLLRN